MIAVLLLSLLLQPSSPLVRTLEVSPRVEANHDTFLYLCSLDVNEQNIGVVAYRNYQRHYFFKTWLRGILPFTLDGEQGSLDGREQPKFWTRTKGCSCETPCVFFYILFLCYFHCLLLTPPHHAFFFFIFFFPPTCRTTQIDRTSTQETRKVPTRTTTLVSSLKLEFEPSTTRSSCSKSFDLCQNGMSRHNWARQRIGCTKPLKPTTTV